MNSGIADYYGKQWQPMVPNLKRDLVPVFNQCVAITKNYTVPAFDLQSLHKLLVACLPSCYLVTGHKPQGRPFWLSVWREDPPRKDGEQINHHQWTTYQKQCPALPDLCKWFLDQLL